MALALAVRAAGTLPSGPMVMVGSGILPELIEPKDHPCPRPPHADEEWPQNLDWDRIWGERSGKC